MLRSKSSFTLSVIVISALLLSSIGLPGHTRAQVRQPTVAQGFEWNLFADPTNMPEFAASPNSGPTAMAFDSRGRLFVGTLSGKIFILLDNNDDGRMDEVKTFATGIPQVLGLEFHTATGDLYATSNVFRGVGRIVRLRDLNGDDRADEQTIVVDNLPSLGDHQTDRLKFGPDGMLYFGQGSSTDNGTVRATEPPDGPLNAAILRINVDNPAINIYATGLRNPFGMAFHPESGALFATDGGSGEVCQSGSCGEDLAPPEEVNWIVPGGNYGFPQCEGTPSADRPGCAGVRSPLIQYPRHLTPTSLAFYTGPQAGEFKNQLLLTLYKNLPNQENYGGDLRRLILEGDANSGFRLRDAGFIMIFEPIDPFDGPVETVVDPVSGDIYVARIDPVAHADLSEHHHFIYRIHREGSDARPFIGPLRPSSVKSGSPALTVSVTGRHLKPGAVIFNLSDNTPLVTRQGASIFELVADLPASAVANERAITLEARNPNGAASNQQTFSVTRTEVEPPPPPPGDKVPNLASLFVYKKKRSKVVNPLTAGAAHKKLRLIVIGTDFDAGARLFANNAALELKSASATELVGFVTREMVAAPGEVTVQVRNSTGKVSNTLKLVIAP